MKKKVALGIAGATAALLGGWKLVQKIVDGEEELFATPAGPAASSSGPNTASWTEAPPASNAAESEDVAKPSPPEFAAEAAATGVDEKSSKAELYELATELKIPGRSKMSKTELLDAIRDAS